MGNGYKNKHLTKVITDVVKVGKDYYVKYTATRKTTRPTSCS